MLPDPRCLAGDEGEYMFRFKAFPQNRACEFKEKGQPVDEVFRNRLSQGP